ncbi:MAG TPA: polysaccharide biosynthesis/export family protein [Gemmatimonadales bacterium]|nr:polysaccharide biosynthesis/export family protein [Gemmatimonadales bacterium]
MRLNPGILLLLGLAFPFGVGAAQGASPDTLFMRLSAAQRAQVTRAELESSLRQIEEVLGSSGYSEALKTQKRAEADVIRRRLAEGDLRPGDVIVLAVHGFAELSGPMVVTADRTIIPPGAGEIPVGNLLRSEIEEYLRQQMRRFVRDPLVRAEAQIRVAVFGGVGKQGYFVVPASAPLTEVIMGAAGGPSGNQQMEKSEIRRGDRVIVDRERFAQAIRDAESLDQLNLQAGDEIRIGQRRAGGLPILAAISAVTSVTYLLFRIF